VNAYASTDQLAAALRIVGTAAADPAALTACLEAAAIEIDDAIDSPDPPDYAEPWNPLLNRVNVLRGVEWFKANDAAFGVLGFDQMGAVRTPRNSFARHAAALLPVQQRFGVG
jgi:hypothetical protein